MFNRFIIKKLVAMGDGRWAMGDGRWAKLTKVQVNTKKISSFILCKYA
jgi:hypothetical protein